MEFADYKAYSACAVIALWLLRERTVFRYNEIKGLKNRKTLKIRGFQRDAATMD